MKLFYTAVVALLITFILIFAPSCAPKPAANATPQVTLATQVSDLQKRIAIAETTIAKLSVQQPDSVSKAQLDSLKTELNNLQKTLTQLQSELSTTSASAKTQEQRIAALEAKLSAGSTGSSGAPVPTGQPITITSNAYNQQIQIPQVYYIQLTIKNNTAVGQKVNLMAQLTRTNVGYTQPVIKVDTTKTVVSASSGYITESGFTMTFTPANGENAILVQGLSKGYILMGGNLSVIVPITLTLAYQDANICPWDMNITAVSTAW